MRAWLPLLLAALTVLPASAWAQSGERDRDAARALATAGFQLFTEGKHEQALERFRGAEAIFHAPPHVLFMGRCLAKLGKLVQARDTYQSLVNEQLAADAPPEFSKAQRQAADEVPAVVARIARLTIEVGAGSSKVTLDGRELSAAELGTAIDVDPGEHRIELQREGVAPQQRVVTLADGGNETVTLDGAVENGPEDPGDVSTAGTESSSFVGPAVLLALGGAAIVVGAITGGLALQKKGELEDACPTKLGCPAESQELEDDGRTLGNVSTVGFVVGGVAAGAGVIWLVSTLSASEPQQAHIEPLVGLGTLGMRLRF